MTYNEKRHEACKNAVEESKNFHLYNALVYHHPKGEAPYVSLDTPEGEFRIRAEMEEGFHGFFASFIKRGQVLEQDICMAELNPDNNKLFSVKVWSNPYSEEYREDIYFGQYIEPRCPYCGSESVTEVDDFRGEIKYFCENCDEDYLYDTINEEYTTCNRRIITPVWERKKEQE